MFSKGGGRLEKWPYLADKCRALRNNNKIGPFLTKTPRCLGFLVFHILWFSLTGRLRAEVKWRAGQDSPEEEVDTRFSEENLVHRFRNSQTSYIQQKRP